MKLLAIDGNSILNRAFYGVRPLTTKDGTPTNAVYGFINILNKLVALKEPDGIAVAFDVHAPTFRHKKYAEYKAGRRPMPEELRTQFPLIKEWLKSYGARVIECEGYEADDILGTLSAMCEKSGDECYISTGDRDALQLVSEKTHVLLAVTKMGSPEVTEYTPEALFEKYGLTPDEMIELKAIMGDTSDNIPGVPGIGEKGATDLITRFSSIEYIYENIDTVDIKDSIRNKLVAGKESAFFSKFLGTINREAPIDNDIKTYFSIEEDKDALSEIMTRLELFKLMDTMGITPGKIKEVKLNKESFEKAEVEDILKLNTEYYIYTDFNTNETAICAGNKVCKIVTDNGMFSQKDVLLEILNSENDVYLYDYKNTCKMFNKFDGFKANIVMDTSLAAYLANPSSSDYGIKRLAAEYTVPEGDVSGSDEEIMKLAATQKGVCKKLYEKLKENNQLKLLNEIELPLARVLASMEQEGFLTDVSGLTALGKELNEKTEELKNEIYELTGENFNLNSPKQLGVVLFEKLGLPAKKKTKSGYSTSAEILEELKYLHPAVEKLLRYRSLAKLKSTYCDALVNKADGVGRIHTTFNQTETRTGRISSLEPNLQNIPVRTQEGSKLRRYFCAKEGCVLVDADYSQIELRVLAALSKDKTMCEAFNTGVDIHTRTASEVFGIAEDMVTPTLRTSAKAVNFGIVYGIGAFSLAKDIGVTRAEADEYIKNYLSTFSGVRDYMEKTISDAKRDGYITTYFGRRRYLPELSATNHMVKAFGERVARNAPIQGTAADIIKIAMINVFNRLNIEIPDAKLIMQVHDELIVECNQDDKQAVAEIVKEEMENAANMGVKFTADVHYGKTWYEAKG